MIWLVACAAHPPRIPALPASREPTTWVSASLVAIDDTTIEEHRTLTTTHAGGDAWRITTVRTETAIERAGETQRFASDAPTSADPWPLVLQHAVASATAEVHSDHGRPGALVDEARWKDAATDALTRLSLPPTALAVGLPLLDPAGLVSDLQRLFPGGPVDGVLSRPEHVAGVDGVRRETCTVTTPAPGHRTWRCDGAITDPSGRLREVESWTELGADRVGLVFVESGYGGILVAERAGGRTLAPIGGRRRIERRDGAAR